MTCEEMLPIVWSWRITEKTEPSRCLFLCLGLSKKIITFTDGSTELLFTQNITKPFMLFKGGGGGVAMGWGAGGGGGWSWGWGGGGALVLNWTI